MVVETLVEERKTMDASRGGELPDTIADDQRIGTRCLCLKNNKMGRITHVYRFPDGLELLVILFDHRPGLSYTGKPEKFLFD